MRERIHLSLTPEQRAQIVAAAKADGRKPSAYVTWVVLQHLAKTQESK
jgi:uncharacterized protein (DUF1778 family)